MRRYVWLAARISLANQLQESVDAVLGGGHFDGASASRDDLKLSSAHYEVSSRSDIPRGQTPNLARYRCRAQPIL